MLGGPDSLLVRLELGVWAEDPQARVRGVPSVHRGGRCVIWSPRVLSWPFFTRQEP